MYKQLCTEYYDLEPHKDHAQALAFYMQLAQQARGPILEPMCGTGRFLIPLAQAGFDIEGFDASEHMLAALKKRVAPKTAPVTQQFVQNFSSPRRYAFMFIPYGSWGLITERRDAQEGLVNLYNHLAPGGTCVFEIETVASAPTTTHAWNRGVHTRADGSHIAINTRPTYNPETQIYQAICHYESIRGSTIDATETEDFRMYLYQFDEFDDALKAAGFTHIKKYVDYQRTPATDPNAPLLIYECSR